MKSLLFKCVSFFIVAFPCWGNELYVRQVGDNTNLTISQDGANNKITGSGGRWWC